MKVTEINKRKTKPMIQLTSNDIDALVLDYLSRKYPHSAYTFKNEAKIEGRILKKININLEEVLAAGIQGLYIKDHLDRPLCDAIYTITDDHICGEDDIPNINLLQNSNNIEILKYNKYLITASGNKLCIYLYVINTREFHLAQIINHAFNESINKIKIHNHILYICFKNSILLVNLFYFFQIRGFPSSFMHTDKIEKILKIIENSKYKLCVCINNLDEINNNLNEIENIESIDPIEFKNLTTINEEIKHIIKNENNYLNNEENQSIILISEENTLYLLNNLNEYFDFQTNLEELEKKIAKYKLNIDIESGKYLSSTIFLGGCKNGDLLILDCKNEKKHIFKGHEAAIYNIFIKENYENKESVLIIKFQTIGKEGKVYEWELNYINTVEIKYKKLHAEFSFSLNSIDTSCFMNVSNSIEIKTGEESIKYEFNEELIKTKELKNFIGFLNKESTILISKENFKYYKYKSIFTDLIFLTKKENTYIFIGIKCYKNVCLVLIEF